MKKIFLLLTVAGALAVCTSPGMTRAPVDKPTTSICGEDLKPRTDATITYRTKNKFMVTMDLKHTVKKNSEFRIKLDPKQDSDDAVIETIGKSGELPGGTLTSSAWLNGKGKAADFPNETMILCVPDVLEGTIYKFDVEIGGIGSIDPRVHVEL